VLLPIVGSVIFAVVGIATTARCLSSRYGVHWSVVAPVVLIGLAVLVGGPMLAAGGTWGTCGGWLWFLAALASPGALRAVHAAIRVTQELAEHGAAHKAVLCAQPPSIDELDELERSLEGALINPRVHRTPIPTETPR
jgi:hypothetical protein